MRGGEASYDVALGDGLLDDLPALLRESCPAACYTVISDATVAPLYAERIAKHLDQSTTCRLLTFPAGEAQKTRATWTDLTDQMLAFGTSRDSAIVAVGGGVVGDMAGFVAATYLRGIPIVQVPTTLLAMIDSSIGGKTGVDTSAGKNLVGAYHQPRLVVADVATLSSLPAGQFACGVAEALKHGAIADPVYFQRIGDNHTRIVERDPEALVELIRGSIAIKADVVAEDEREAGRRAVLNFGHTVAHALEADTSYGILHGEAVATGMVLEAELGTALGITEKATAPALRSAIERFHLPATLPAHADPAGLLARMLHDKKVRDGEIRFTLLKHLGQIARTEEGQWTHPVEQAPIAALLNSSF